MWADAGYLLLILLVAVERLAELLVANRNARLSLARGGIEVGRRHYGFLVAVHTGLLLGCLLEVPLAHRPFVPALGWPMLALVGLAQALRWWCIATLGSRWNTRVIVVPGEQRIQAGPYRWLPHPNYLAVVLEGVALPLVHSAWLTALAFTVVNSVLLVAVRIPVESRALVRLVRTGSGGATDG